MLQNVYVAGKARDPGTANFHFTNFDRIPTIIGKRQRFKDDVDSLVDLNNALADVSELSGWLQSFERQRKSADIPMPKWLASMEREDGVPSWFEPLRADRNNIANTHGALKELEKWVPTAGLAMIQVFFPTSLRYNDDNIRDNVHKRFWKRAYHTKGVRRRAEHKRREVERSRKVKKDRSQKSATSDQAEV